MPTMQPVPDKAMSRFNALETDEEMADPSNDSRKRNRPDEGGDTHPPPTKRMPTGGKAPIGPGPLEHRPFVTPIAEDRQTILDHPAHEQQTPEINVVTAPHDSEYAIEGTARKELLALAGKATMSIWDKARDPKVIAHIPGDQYRRDPSVTVSVVYNVAVAITGNIDLVVLPATPATSDKWPEQHMYVPTLIGNMSAEDHSKLTAHRLFSTAYGTIVTLPYHFKPSPFIMQIGDTNLTCNPLHIEDINRVYKEEIQKTTGAIYRKIGAAYDNIPTRYTTNAARAQYIASTVRVDAITISLGRSTQTPMPMGAPTERARFSLFAEPPSLIPDRNKEWIDCFTRLQLIGGYGPLHVVDTFFCTHCSGRTHPSGLCPYPNLDGFADTQLPTVAVPSRMAGRPARGSPSPRSSARGYAGRGRGKRS